MVADFSNKEIWKSKVILINKILADWDPIGVGEPLNKEEYKSYALTLYGKLLKDEDLHKYMQSILKHMGFEDEPTNLQQKSIDRVVELIERLKY